MMVPKHSTFSKGGVSKGKTNIDPPIPKEREVDKEASKCLGLKGEKGRYSI